MRAASSIDVTVAPTPPYALKRQELPECDIPMCCRHPAGADGAPRGVHQWLAGAIRHQSSPDVNLSFPPEKICRTAHQAGGTGRATVDQKECGALTGAHRLDRRP